MDTAEMFNVLRLAFVVRGTHGYHAQDWKMRLSVGPMHCLWDPHTSFFSKIFIKNGSHGTIHIFKNYFTTVFSVFSFQ